MLKLEKLELRGFKSFCDHTEFHLNETVTAIVGPNGCGKSNLADAITWVLGEQSARLLRGAKMEEVIFQGSRHRPPIGLAEVTLTLLAQQELSTGNGKEAREDSETEATDGASGNGSQGFMITVAPGERITVGRRLYRSGESEYLLNGRRVRLRDIYDLFAGTGLGPGHYAIIGQGHVDEIPTAKPFERRAVIEAAAGITKFRLRQRTIELRLQSAKQNLERINDLVVELDRQVRSLKRQAAKARRYRRLKEELRGLLRILLTSEYHRIESELEAINEQAGQAGSAHAAVQEEVARLEGEYRGAIEATRKGESALNQLRDQLNAVDLQVERTRSQRTSCQEHIANLESKRLDAEREETMLRQRLIDLEQEIEQSAKEVEALSQAVQSDREALSEREAVYKAELDRVKAAERQLETLRQQLLEETNNHANLRNATQQMEVDLERVERQLNGLQVERERALAKRQELAAQQVELSGQVARDRAHIEEVNQQVTTLEDGLQQARLDRANRGEQLAVIERERLAVEERLALLIELDRQRAYCSPAVQRLFEVGAQENHVRLLGTLADFVQVKREHERIVESVLGDRLQTILVPSIEDATRSIAFLGQTSSGQATFLVVGIQGGGHAPELERTDAADGEAGAVGGDARRKPFLEILNLRSGLLEPFRRAFPEIAEAQMVADLDTAIELAFNDGGRLFLTPEGHRVRAGSLIAGGGTEEGVKSLLAIKREMHELRARVAELSQATEAANSQLAASEGRVEEFERTLHDLRAQRQANEKTTLERGLQLTTLESDLARADQHLRVVDFELTQAETDRQELVAKRNRLAEVQQQAAAALARIKTESEHAQTHMLEIRDEADQLAEELSSRRAQVATTVERQRGLETDHQRLEREREEIEFQSEANDREVARVEEEITRLQTSLRSVEQAIGQLEAERIEVEAQTQRASQDLEQLYQRADEFNARLDERRVQERELREQMAQLEVQRAQLLSDARHLGEMCLSELGQSLEEVIGLVAAGENPVETPTDVGDAQAVKGRVQELRLQLEEMGPINMMALEELEAQQERLEFLEVQRRDVIESIASTEKALDEIKRRSRRRFSDAFEAINAHFGQVFQELFGGGQGRMILLDEDNPLESGIDIIAQPPGKRLQNIMLLSGGEKAMTAIALLLAIFRYRPSPFCVLDEVDAQLDEVNVRRFAKKIEEMSAQTQFVLITHNKTTMLAAGALHGVTMEEPGISKLVSVRLK
jgi:chromosome segregation protein